MSQIKVLNLENTDSGFSDLTKGYVKKIRGEGDSISLTLPPHYYQPPRKLKLLTEWPPHVPMFVPSTRVTPLNMT